MPRDFDCKTKKDIIPNETKKVEQSAILDDKLSDCVEDFLEYIFLVVVIIAELFHEFIFGYILITNHTTISI